MKTIFGRNSQHEESQPNSDQRLRNVLADIEKYLADNFGTVTSALTSDNPTFSTAVVILAHTNGMLNLPNNVILLGYVKTDKGDDYLIEHLGNFIKYLMKVGTPHGIQYFAIAFSKERDDYPNIVQTADVTCLRLY